MKPKLMLTITTLLLLAALPVAAYAMLTEVGKTAEQTPPSCPQGPCFAISRTTGFQAKVGPKRGDYTVPRNGRIVAWSVTLGKPGKKQTSYFESKLGGPASAQLTILKPGKKLFFRVVAQSPVVELTKYFGQTYQVPLVRSLAVHKGWIVALTVPTWAPTLSVGLGNDHSWRASRPAKRCDDNQSQTAQQQLKALAQYTCLYKTARLTYSATLISSP